MLLMFTLRPSTTFNAFFQRQLTCCFGIFPISIGIPVVLIDITGTINRGFLPRDAKGILRGKNPRLNKLPERSERYVLEEISSKDFREADLPRVSPGYPIGIRATGLSLRDNPNSSLTPRALNQPTQQVPNPSSVACRIRCSPAIPRSIRG